ncbi:hypothetical protein CGZ80_08950 [Rhodopirellula sp. MGV]|nr:hypothetical protein CGZ80_08950 [Rhodopirellula sp. MGV]PNY36887.1 radical SAM protein [Rhodopirellula baltica]
MTTRLSDAIAGDHYAGYAYAYPHKTSYRLFDHPVDLPTAWSDEDKSRLFLYVHLPFCEMRCGFCNLFTASQPPSELVRQTLDAIETQSRVVSGRVEPQRVVQVAFGGGTPTYLTADELERLLVMMRCDWPIESEAPFSVEVSPATVDATKLTILRDHGVRRISMGVQSFVSRDLNQLGRPQDHQTVEHSIELIRQSGIDLFNLDLIYGNQGQTESDWFATVRKALQYDPGELFLYPLYVRKLTGLGKTGRSPAENRRHMYRLGRELLLDAGYRQISMRMFRKSGTDYGTQHCCQEDGMIGLGPGARSYTRELHYSSEYAVSGSSIRKIIDKFNRRDPEDFALADYGVWLNAEEQSRRYLIRSLLQVDGLDRQAFASLFGADVCLVLPQVEQLLESGFAELTAERLMLTAEGLAHSDVIGPWLYSDAVLSRMEQFELQ